VRPVPVPMSGVVLRVRGREKYRAPARNRVLNQVLSTAFSGRCWRLRLPSFLWVLPLGLYLITFIICFENPRWYRRRFFFSLMFLSVFLAILLLNEGLSLPLPLQVAGYSAVMFACCMTCHGELAKAKPATGFRCIL